MLRYGSFLFTILAMTLDALIMLAGAFVIVLPFLGFPTNWDTALLVIVGVCIVGLGIVVRRRISHDSDAHGDSVAITDTEPRS